MAVLESPAILVRNPPGERLARASQDPTRPRQKRHLQSEDDINRGLPLPLFEENSQNPPPLPVSRPKQIPKLVLRLFDIHTASHITPSTVPRSTSNTAAVTRAASISISTPQLQKHRIQNKPVKRSSSLSLMLGGVRRGLPGFRHSQSHDREAMLASIESASPTTPTQATTRIGSTNSTIWPPPLSASSPSSTTPTTYTNIPLLPINISATTTRARGLATASSTSSPQPQPQPLSFAPTHIPPEPKLKTKHRSSPSLKQKQRQNSISNSNWNATRTPITSPRNSPPPDFLLDDDPFADLTGGPVAAGGKIGRQSSSVSRKLSETGSGSGMGDVKTSRLHLFNDECDHEHGEERGVGSGTATAGSRIGPATVSGSSTILNAAPAPFTGPSIVPGSGSLVKGPVVTTPRSMPTSPSHSSSRSTSSSFRESGIRSSFPSTSSSPSSIHRASTSSKPSAMVSSGPTNSSHPQPPNSPPPLSAIPRKLSQPPPPIVSRSSFSYHSSSASASSSPPTPTPFTSHHHHPSTSSQQQAPVPHRPGRAHQRPAFRSRPSLPSLDTLAKMNFAPGAGLGVKKVRKGKVGAGLPLEPWNNLDHGMTYSSGETSPDPMGGEGPGVGNGSGDGAGGGAVPPIPPLPISVSVSRSFAKFSFHETNHDLRVSMSSPPSPTFRYPSASSITSSSSVSGSTSSNSTSQPYTQANAHLPPNASLVLASSALACQPIPPGQKPLLPSQILALGSEIGVVYGYDGGSGMATTELEPPSRSPTTSPAPLVSPLLVPQPPQLQLMSRSEDDRIPPSTDVFSIVDIESGSTPAGSSGMGVGLDVIHGRDNRISRLGPKKTGEVGLESYYTPNSVLARHNGGGGYAEGDDIIGAEARGYNDVDADADDVDVDRFMDQFMDHYERLDWGRDLQADGGDDAVLEGKVDKRLVTEEDEDVLVPPRLRSPTPPSAIAASLIKMAPDVSVSRSGTMSSMDSSATLPSAFPESIAVDTSSAILAPTVRTRTRMMRTVPTSTTTGVNMDGEASDSSLVDSRPHPSSQIELEPDRPLSVSTSSASGLTPPMSSRGSTRSAVSRSRSFSSTYTTLSFGSESESSSYPQSPFDGDETEADIGASGVISRSNGNNINNNKIQHQPPDTTIPPSMHMKSAAAVALQATQVSVIESPASFMPFSGNEDNGYPVTVPAGTCSMPSVHRGSLSSDTGHEEIPICDDNTNTNDSVTAPITTARVNEKDNDDSIGHRVGEVRAGDDGLIKSRRRSRCNVVSELRVGGECVLSALVMPAGKDVVEDEMTSEDEVVLFQEREEDVIVVGRNHELAAEMKTEEDVEMEIGHDVEWEYVVGAGSFVGGDDNGRKFVFGHEQHVEGVRSGEEMSNAGGGFSEPFNDDDDMNLVMRHSPPITSTTSLTMPTMTRFISTSDALLGDYDLACGSSTAVAAALAMSTWKRDTSELVNGVEMSSAARRGDRNSNEGYGSSYSSTHKSGGSTYHATHGLSSNLNSSAFEWRGHGGRRGGGGDDDDDDDERRRRQRAALGSMNESSFLAISSESSSSSGDDDDHYGLTGSPPSQPIMKKNLRSQPSVTYSIRTTPSTGHVTPSTQFPSASSGSGNSSASGSGFFDDDEEDDDDDDDYGEEDDQQAHHDRDDDDDNIPLAKSIPNALTAQKSIRHQVRQEREKKKQEKALRARTRLMTLRPTGAASPHDAALLATTVASSSQATMHHQHLEQQEQSRRQRTKTVTRKGSISGNPFSPEDLARKLRDINGWDSGVEAAPASAPIGATALYQQQRQQRDRQHSRHRSRSVSRSSWDSHPAYTHEALPPVPIPHTGSAISHAPRTGGMKEPSLSHRYHPSSSSSPINSVQGPSSMTTLRHMRSFHRPNTDRRPVVGMDDPRSVPLPSDAEQKTSRSSVTRSRPPTRDGPQTSTNPTPISTPHHRSFSQSRSSTDRASPSTIQEPVPAIPTGRISHDEHPKLFKSHHYESSSSRVGSTRTSVDTERLPRTSSHQHRTVPAPTLPSTSATVDPLLMPMTTSKPEVVVQQRVFVGDMQRFKMVEIATSTTAGDVIEMIEVEGSLVGFAGSGGWMVFEVAQDFGMERPIRTFELVADVQASWNKDKMVNYLVLRLTPLAVPLNRSAIPSSSPTHSGYVEWEVKRGKWSKRWMQLREHSIWLSKRDNGRDQVQLCSLSNFDAYQITRSHRAPKPFSFAVKSTDKLSFFENTADYVHSFACSEKDGTIWMEKILVARSYVLFQERHVLFNPKAVNGNASGITRSGTRKVTSQRPAVQPLIIKPPLFVGATQTQPHHDVFEPGSLLSKKL